MSDEIRISVSLPLDSDGFLRRACPTCEREFKRLVSDEEAHEELDPAGHSCPYCAIQAPPDHWLTEAQVDFGRDRLTREEMDPFFAQLERSGFRVERNLPAEPVQLTEDDDMRRVDFTCHPANPVKVLDDWRRPVHCLLCCQPVSS